MVGKICNVCRKSSVANKNLSFFSYPGDRQRRYKWLKALNRLDLVEKLSDNKSRGNHRICEDHFQDSYIKMCSGGPGKSRKCLTKDACPTLEHVNKTMRNKLKASESSEAKSDVDNKCSSKQKNGKVSEDESDNTKDFINISDVHNDFRVTVDVTVDPMSDPNITDNDDKVSVKIERMDEDCDQNPHNSHFASPETPGFPDMSQFCESVIKVCKQTQTSTQELEEASKRTKRRKLDIYETHEQFLQSCSKNLPKGMLQLVKWQLNSKENVDNYKFHMFALNMYFSGANTYHFLKDMMGLPAISEIKHLLLPRATRFDNSLINILKIKVNNMSQRERICSASIGCMQLKPSLYYNIKKDKVEGFHEIDGVQKMEPAKYALVFMVQGIIDKWAQPIAYAFISRLENSSDISIWVEEIMTLLIDVGLDVRAFVSDPKTEPLYMLESQRVTPAKPYFSMNNKNIYYIYDTVGLQGSVKKCLKSYNFHVDETEHIANPEFTTRFNNLCNILNTTSSMSLSPFKRAYCNRKYQSKFLKDTLAMFQNLKVVRKGDGLKIKNLKFIDSIQISIISVMQLYNDLKEAGVKSLLTSRLSQKCLNKFFAKAKSNCKTLCTSRRLQIQFNRCFVYNMLKKPTGDRKGNSAQAPFNAQSLLTIGRVPNQTIKVDTTDYRVALPEKKRFETVCRYLYLKCIDYHSCDSFKEYLSRSPESRLYVAPYRSSAPLDIRNCKLTPPQDFTEFIGILEKRFRDYCKQDIKVSSLGHQILKKIASFEFDAPCSCFPLDYLKKLFVRLRIFYVVRENNIAFKKDANDVFCTFNL